MSGKGRDTTNALLSFTLKRPFLTGLTLLAIAFFFKWVDTFVLRLDELLGEAILCKSLGFALVILFVWACGRSLRDIGLHSRRLGPSLLIGSVLTIAAMTVGYGAEFVVQLQQGTQPVFQFAAIDPKAGVTGGALFAVWLVATNFVNSFMEEGLFRGVMIRLYRVKLSFWLANGLQALLFGVWHLPWVIKYYQTGQIETPGEILFSAVMNFLPMLLIGLVYGYFYLKTDSLWTSWVAHWINNTILNLLHITTIDGMDSGIVTRGAVYLVVALLSLFVAKVLAERFRMPEVKPWGEWATSDANQTRAEPAA
jgi:membrane protease YdiL (CAAX protease family)